MIAKDIAKAEADTEDDIWEIDEEQIEKEIYGNL